jgi:hypothetical protein
MVFSRDFSGRVVQTVLPFQAEQTNSALTQGGNSGTNESVAAENCSAGSPNRTDMVLRARLF